MNFNTPLLFTIWILVIWGQYLDLNRTDRIIAAITDNGCNSHKQLHIEQEHTLRIDNYNLNSLRGDT